jgi:hypothetical protein
MLLDGINNKLKIIKRVQIKEKKFLAAIGKPPIKIF